MLVRALIWLIVGFLAYTVFQVIKQALNRPPAPPSEKTSIGEDMVQDPECGTYVPKSDAIKASAAGKTHYYCSTDCRDKHQKRSG